MKRDGTAWSRLVLAELSQEKALMGRLDPRYRNMQEAEGGRIASLFLYFD